MIPSEQEYQVATHAAARKAFQVDIATRRKVYPPSTQFPEWDDLELADQRAVLEAVLPIVDAAISAIPDRLDAVRTLADLELDDQEFRALVVKLVEQ